MKEMTALEIGKEAPSFQLKGVDGNTHTLESFRGAKAVAVIFMCNHCPYVQAYLGRLISLQNEYAGQGVRFVGINSNETKNYPEDNFENMVRWAKEKKFPFPYLRDETQEVATAYGANRTPEIFLLDASFRVCYHGGVDDNTQNPKEVRAHYLRNAIEDLLQKGSVSQTTSRTIGCTIKWA